MKVGGPRPGLGRHVVSLDTKLYCTLSLSTQPCDLLASHLGGGGGGGEGGILQVVSLDRNRSPLPGACNCLFLDQIFDKFRLPWEPRLLITSFANLIIKLSVIKSPWRFCQ